MISDWLKTTLKKRKISQAELGRMLTKKLGRSIDHAAANKMANGLRAIAADELMEIELILGEQAPGRQRPVIDNDEESGIYYEEQFIYNTIETIFSEFPLSHFKHHSPKELARLVILCLNEAKSKPSQKDSVSTVISLFEKLYLLEERGNDQRGTGNITE